MESARSVPQLYLVSKAVKQIYKQGRMDEIEILAREWVKAAHTSSKFRYFTTFFESRFPFVILIPSTRSTTLASQSPSISNNIFGTSISHFVAFIHF